MANKPDGTTARLRDLLPFTAGSRVRLGFAALLSLIVAGLLVVQPLLVQEVIGAAELQASVVGPATLLLCLTVVAALLSCVQSYLLRSGSESIVASIRGSYLAKLFHLPMKDLDTRSYGDLISRISSDAALIRSVVTSGLVEVLSSAVMLVAAVVIMWILDPVLLVVALSMISVGTVISVLLAKKLRPANYEMQHRVGTMAGAVQRALHGMRTIRASSATERENEVAAGSVADVLLSAKRIAKLEALVQPVLTICIQGAFVATIAIGGLRVASGALPLASLMSMVLYLFLLTNPISQMMGVFSQIQVAIASFNRIREITEQEDEREQIDQGDAEPDAIVTRLEFDHVNFAYTPQSPVLRDVTFSASLGQRVAIVGPSGAGKSTLFALIERFYDPVDGEIRLNGTPLREFGLEALRRRIGYVEQDSPALSGTVSENLRLAAHDATDDELRRVLADVGLEDIARRDDGLGSALGESGLNLSGGQRQRLAWARTLLSKPSVVLLDEPTSAVDAITEEALQSLISQGSDHRLTLVIAHRMATVVGCDRIIVLDEGRVVDAGTHAELVARSVLYRRLAHEELTTDV
ncbi:MAG: ABC transporter ATP-binding protein [Micrococcaceae bacterium]|uniref:ABC transporter ATP-binding protein n=1 Tax=Microbacterium sp. JB110 TaxID=2024477 RepID=UPI00097F16BE|nr:ABC transporter ATP-binding protein [Microbacterium sp. JB110]SJM57327.1 ABC transporter ATP-binding protein [Frigoribacterium sp. JB110]